MKSSGRDRPSARTPRRIARPLGVLVLALAVLTAPVHAACGCCMAKAVAARDAADASVCCASTQPEVASRSCCASPRDASNTGACTLHHRDSVEACNCGPDPATTPAAVIHTAASNRDDHRPASSHLDAAALVLSLSGHAAPAAFGVAAYRPAIPRPPYYLANCVLLT